MASEKSTWAQHDTLDQFQGTFTEQLRSLLRVFGYPTDIPVKTYTFTEGEELVKYPVLVIIPREFTPCPFPPRGEGLSVTAAYNEAVLEAIATIRENRAVELEGTSFIALPHSTHSTEEMVDHSVLVKTKPRLATRLLDRYRQVVGSLYNTHCVMVEDKDVMIEDREDPRRRKRHDKKVVPEIGEPSRVQEEGTPRRPSQYVPLCYSPTPEPIFYPEIAHRDPLTPVGAYDDETPMENSDGWRYNWYAGTNQDPVPVYDTDDSVVDIAPPGQAAGAGADHIVINISSDEDENVNAYQAGQDAASYVGMGGLFLDTSDTNYVPPGRLYTPDSVRRTSRHQG